MCACACRRGGPSWEEGAGRTKERETGGGSREEGGEERRKKGGGSRAQKGPGRGEAAGPARSLLPPRAAPRPAGARRASSPQPARALPAPRLRSIPGSGPLSSPGEMSASTAPERGWKSEKVDEAQALARSCAARRPDFQPCDGLSICATHSHGKCFKLHWCCHLGWCHCKWSRVGLRSSACGPALPGRREEIPGEPGCSPKRGPSYPREPGSGFLCLSFIYLLRGGRAAKANARQRGSLFSGVGGHRHAPFTFLPLLSGCC